MKSLTYNQAYSLLEKSNNLTKKEVGETLAKSVGFYEVLLEDKETLFHLLYQSTAHLRILTPLKGYKNHHYTLENVVDRMIENQWTFEDLANGRIKGDYQQEFFKQCQTIYQNYDPEKTNYLLLRPFSDRSRYFCPSALFYIEDGGHRTLVTAYLIKTNQLTFTPIKTILCLPNQHKKGFDKLKVYL